ncbi:MAG TPA: molybdenum cofactor guanylyltransferase [Bacteroidales bacterium]|nr:molybdenum cofactor guanylyltransferase [Bacteroidales bacterium]HNY57795.1 molybdenum cofactor guanylyltransferase [Bacteroidales bacterium]HOC04706.1 molybdenum cofactor guanylyltransferase [Bacteroidales bacterium]HOH15133.1 molybdenum cofactor guanylyltransferase [Bacteroidales bacterium]HPV26670.1 molybdenum cofactor guanylyltransferase [Bacteroidales bacterium]
MPVDGVTVISRTISLLEPLFSEIIVAGWPPDDPLPGDVILVHDRYSGVGPLAGIEAALRVAGSPLLFVFGGDMPWLSEELIRAQVNEYIANPSDILIARSGGLAEPLHSLYSRKIHTALVSHIEGGGSNTIIDFCKLAETRYYDIPLTPETRKALTNINRPEDLLI